ncbi:MAG: cation diffusion facilitator family transporter [Bdellovibrionota bacterium]
MYQEPSILRRRLSVLCTSLIISLVIMGIKWWAYMISGSVALKTDALESFINIIAITMAIVAVYHAERPADWNHPYGHGKIEFFSSAIEGGMLLFAGCYLIYDSIQHLVLQNDIKQLNYALVLSAGSGIMNGVLGAWQLNAGKKLHSEAIIADAKHILSDFYTSIAIILGLLLAEFSGFMFLDSIFAIGVALLLIKHASDIIRRAAMLLSDTEDLN